MTDGAPQSSRPPPPTVEPVTLGGVRYEQDLQSSRFGGTQPGGYLVALDAVSGERLWMLKVYDIASQEAYGVTTPGRYFRSMVLLPGRAELEIVNEAGALYRVDLDRRKSTWVSGPA